MAKAGRFGTEIAFVHGRQLDAGITASTTVNIPIAAPFRKCYIESAGVCAQTLPIGGGAITGILYKKPVGATAVALTAATDLTVGLQVAQVVGTLAILSSVTDAQRILNEGDSLYFAVTAAGTVTTQPVGTIPVVELSVLQ